MYVRGQHTVSRSTFFGIALFTFAASGRPAWALTPEQARAHCIENCTTAAGHQLQGACIQGEATRIQPQVRCRSGGLQEEGGRRRWGVRQEGVGRSE